MSKIIQHQILESFIEVSREYPDTRELITQDPRSFLNRHSEGAILDEI